MSKVGVCAGGRRGECEGGEKNVDSNVEQILRGAGRRSELLV